VWQLPDDEDPLDAAFTNVSANVIPAATLVTAAGEVVNSPIKQDCDTF
jgi:hypothetical protein